MKGFTIIAYDDVDSDLIHLDQFSKHLDDEKINYEKREFESDHHNVIVGFQFFDEDNSNKEISIDNSNIFVNGAIYGSIDNLNDERSDDQTTKDFIKNNDKLDDTFLSFDGNCVYAIVKNNAIYLQNDFEGYKRIFYYKTDNIFCVSTSLPFITKIINQSWKIRKNAIFSHLLQRECKWPLTFVEGIMVLPPITRAVYAHDSFKFSSKTFADAYKNKSVTRDEIKNEVYQDYKNIILRESYGKVAVTLSGGYDSNCLVKLYKDNFKAPFTAVSLGYASNRKKDSNVYDETIYAQKIADKLGIDFKRYLIDERQFFDHLDQFIESLDQPAHDPSSNFLLNKLLKQDGFDCVVSGMGGDANYSSKFRIKTVKKLFDISKALQTYPLLHFFSKKLSFKGPLNYFNTKSFVNKPQSFFDLVEVNKISKSSFNQFLSPAVSKSLYQEIDFRRAYYKNIVSHAHNDLDIFYSISVLTNPDEYHADLMAERNGLTMIMPYVNIRPITKILNGSKYQNINNREYQMELFGGIDKELLLKSKSGFSFPYTEWMKNYVDEVDSYYSKYNYFSKEDFDFSSFIQRYRDDQAFADQVIPNQIIWKLLVIMKYIKLHSFSL